MRAFIIALLLVFASSSAAAQQYVSPYEFPRLGRIAIGSKHNYEDPARQAALAKFDVIILGIWPNWESGRGITMDGVIRNIKKINPRAKVLLYVMNSEFDDANLGSTWPDLNRSLYANGWWLYKARSSGDRVKAEWGVTHYMINNTLLGKRDSSGMNFVEWFGKYAVNALLKPNPAADGFFLDAVYVKPRVNGDWNLDGVIDDKNNPTVQKWIRDGYRAQVERFRANAPGKLMTGNLFDFGAADAKFPELDQVFEGGVAEGMLGETWSPESWGGWATMMQYYRKTLYSTKAPRLLIFDAHGTATDYQTFRYAFASCLMDDGVFAYNHKQFGPPEWWFDEYDVRLGKALAGPSTKAWKNGVYRRDFENGIVLVNPKGNGAKTVDLGGRFRHISGKQDRAVNSGATVDRVALKDRDGVVLLRLNTPARPRAPGNLTVN